MNKKKTANLIMVLLILAIAIGGVVTAVLLKGHSDTGLGSLYKITAIPGNTLTEPGQDTCTVTIVCDTILDNQDSLNEEKAPFVPADGVILPKTTVSFAQGDTVYQVLQKVTQAADIQMESSWTPMYDSYCVAPDDVIPRLQVLHLRWAGSGRGRNLDGRLVWRWTPFPSGTRR